MNWEKDTHEPPRLTSRCLLTVQTDNSGVYQSVLDGRKGTWWFGSGWCCSNPSLPWGDGFNTYAGEVNNFTNSLSADGTTWTTTTTHLSTGTTATNKFPLGMDF